MHSIRLLLFACAALIFTQTATAFAAPERQTFWRYKDVEIHYKAGDFGLLPLRFKGTFKARFLLGEPVVNCTAQLSKYREEQVIAVADDGDGARRVLKTTKPGEMDVYNLVIVAQMSDPRDKSYGGSARTLAVTCDAGVVGTASQHVFNVAGSPNWDKYLCALRKPYSYNRPASGYVPPDTEDVCEAMGGKWLSAQEARAIARNGLDFKSFAVQKVQVSLGRTLQRIEKNRWREKSAAYHRAEANAFAAGLRNGTMEASYRASDFLSGLPNLPQENPSAEQLAAYRTAYKTQVEHFARHARIGWSAGLHEKQKGLVTEQLEHVKIVKARVDTEQKPLKTYRKLLQKRLEALKAAKKWDLLGAETARDSATDKYGYKVPGSDEWIIKPQFLQRFHFDEDGTASVIVADELVNKTTRSVQFCGKTEKVTDENRRRKIGKIDRSGAFVGEPAWEEYKNDSGGDFRICLHSSHG